MNKKNNEKNKKKDIKDNKDNFQEKSKVKKKSLQNVPEEYLNENLNILME